MSKARIIGGSLAAVAALFGSMAVVNEGVVLHSYADPVWGWKVPTACAGETGPHIQKGMTFTMDECMAMLGKRAPKIWSVLENCVQGDIRVNEAAALVSLADSVGTSPVCASTMVRLHNEGQPASVWCAQFDRWHYAGGLDCRTAWQCSGIIDRRKRERAVCEGNQ